MGKLISAGGGVGLGDTPTWTGQHTFAIGTITTSKPLEITQTWNDGAVTFTTFRVNVTNTASIGPSYLIDAQAGGVSQFSVSAIGITSSTYFVAAGYVRALGAYVLSSDGWVRMSAPEAGVLKIADFESFTGVSIEYQEMTAPAAPSANRGRVYMEDNGSGKTRMMVKFASGAAQQIAIEPCM